MEDEWDSMEVEKVGGVLGRVFKNYINSFFGNFIKYIFGNLGYS